MSDTIKDQVDAVVHTSSVGPAAKVDEVILQVDYQIIEHFSEHLYDSPNKAVEELVANSFDAFATHVRVFTPGPYAARRVIVWDNGESMGVQGLQQLWWIAKSPKVDGKREERRGDKTRKIIGKFGIGKLASYSVGEVISHVCRHQGEYYLVCIDYAEISGTQGTPPVSSSRPIRAPVIRLEEGWALELLKGLFETPPPSIDAMLEEESWTFAIIEKLKVDDLPSGRLKWVLGNGMPLRPDFAIKVNEETVSPKIEKDAVVEWDFGTAEIVSAVKQRWADAKKSGEVSGTVKTGRKKGLDATRPIEDIPFIEFPNLGSVWGHVRLFDETLLKYRSADTVRSHGFFLLVRGRLLNPDDAKLYLPDPSFQTFYRSQYVIHADDLDRELLADRQRLRRDEPSEELELLQRTLAAVARTRVEARDEQREHDQSTRAVLPIGSRTYYRDPLNALLLRIPIEDVRNFDPTTVNVERRPLGENEPISCVVPKVGSFYVNTTHPYYTVLEKRAGQSRAAREFFRTFDLFAISERLLEGHLLDIGISEGDVGEVVGWREGLFRRLAKSFEEGLQLVSEMYQSSYVGGKKFEKALYRIFEDMGFSAQHDGASGQKDILVVATVGPEEYRFTVEAKGSQGEVENESAQVGAAANHRDQVGASHAVIIARRFAGLENKGEKAAVFKECQSTQGVSILEVEALGNIYSAVNKFSYPLSLLRDIFTRLETPRSKLDRIAGLTKPSEGFDYPDLLERIWRRQGGAAAGDVVTYRSIYQDGPWKDKGIGIADFQRRLVALDTLAAGRISMNTNREQVYLRQSPDLVLAQIEKSLRGGGHDVVESSPEQAGERPRD